MSVDRCLCSVAGTTTLDREWAISCAFYVTIVFSVFTLHRDACNKICKTLSVVRFMQHHSVELNRYIMLGPENDKQKVLFI